MTDAPERIWLTSFVKDNYGARLGRGTVSDLDHSPDPDCPEYIRADTVAAMVADARNAVKVKPLVWEYHPFPAPPPIFQRVSAERK